MYHQFKRGVAQRGDAPFLGTRKMLEKPDANGKPVFGDYEWMSWRETDNLCQNLAKGLMKLALCPCVEGEGR